VLKAQHTVTECDTHRIAIGWQHLKSRSQATTSAGSNA
jgi:hypothetical protein